MKCPIENPDTAPVILDYCARRLDAETAAAIDRHMRDCPACREFSKAQRAVWEALDTWDAEPVAADFDRRLYGRIEREAQLSWWRRPGPPRPGALRRGLQIAAAACLLVVAGAILERSEGPAPPEGARAEAVQPEQIERALDDLELLQNFSREVRAQSQAPSSL